MMNVRELIKFTQAELEHYEERAAILQFSAGYSREAAERSAYEAVMLARATVPAAARL